MPAGLKPAMICQLLSLPMTLAELFQLLVQQEELVALPSVRAAHIQLKLFAGLQEPHNPATLAFGTTPLAEPRDAAMPHQVRILMLLAKHF